jgi:hypothetical protein
VTASEKCTNSRIFQNVGADMVPNSMSMALLHFSRPPRRSPQKRAIIEWIEPDDNP